MRKIFFIEIYGNNQRKKPLRAFFGKRYISFEIKISLVKTMGDIEEILKELSKLGIIKEGWIRRYTNILNGIKYRYEGKLPKWELKGFLEEMAKIEKTTLRQEYNHFRKLRQLGFVESMILGSGEYWILSDRFGSKLWRIYKKYREWLKE